MTLKLKEDKQELKVQPLKTEANWKRKKTQLMQTSQ
jgi:hypothetical protein